MKKPKRVKLEVDPMSADILIGLLRPYGDLLASIGEQHYAMIVRNLIQKLVVNSKTRSKKSIIKAYNKLGES